MIITCPNCHTNYQVAQKAISAAGRKVLCANCQQSWQAKIPEHIPEAKKPKLVGQTETKINQQDDAIFSEKDEAILDQQFSKQEQQNNLTQKEVLERVNVAKGNNTQSKSDTQSRNKVNQPNQLDKGLNKKQKMALIKRKGRIAQNMPLNKLKRMMRIWMIITLIIIGFVGFYLRNNIVQTIPQFALIYKILSIDVNIIGLEFNNVKTLLINENSVQKLEVTTKILNITNKSINIPTIIVSIVDENNISLMEWGIKPTVSNLEARTSFDFATQLEGLPKGANIVKLSFAK